VAGILHYCLQDHSLHQQHLFHNIVWALAPFTLCSYTPNGFVFYILLDPKMSKNTLVADAFETVSKTSRFQGQFILDEDCPNSEAQAIVTPGLSSGQRFAQKYHFKKKGVWDAAGKVVKQHMRDLELTNKIDDKKMRIPNAHACYEKLS